MIIDFHTHYYPQKFLNEIERNGHRYDLEIQTDEAKRKTIKHRGNAVCTLTAEMNNLSRRLEDMDRHGIDKQVLSLSVPGIDAFSPREAQFLAKTINDEMIQIGVDYPDRFMGLGVVPLKSIQFAMEELTRIIKAGLKGVILGSNVNGVFLDDESYFPFFQQAERLKAVLFVHSASPVNRNGMHDYRLTPMLGFMVDESLALLRMTLSGLFERVPNLKIIAGQLGGIIPFLIGRIDKCFNAYPECRHNIKKPPSHYLRNIYLDTVSFHKPALQCALDLWGHKRLIFGSDYPQVIGDVGKAIESLESSDLSSEKKAAIYAENLLDLTEDGS